MGLTEEQFFRLTPRKYWLLLVQHREKQRDMQWLTGLLAATMWNSGMRAPEKPVQPSDLPLPLLQRRAKRRRKISERKRAEYQLRSYFARKGAHAGVIRIKGGPE